MHPHCDREADGIAEPMPRILLIRRVLPPKADEKQCLDEDDLAGLVIGIVERFGSLEESRPSLISRGKPRLMNQGLVAVAHGGEEDGLQKKIRGGIQGMSITLCKVSAVEDGIMWMKVGEVAFEERKDDWLGGQRECILSPQDTNRVIGVGVTWKRGRGGIRRKNSVMLV